MAFPPDFLDEIRSRVGVAQVVGRRVKLTRKGHEYSGLCPFHNEKTPSFTVNDAKGFFHCFGCGAHGDAIGFEMRANHLSFTEAVEKLAAEAGLEVPKASPEERLRDARRASLHDAMDMAAQFYAQQLKTPAGRDGLAYLRNRGLTDETIARFRLGWSPDSRDALKKALMSERCPESLLIEAGLLKKPEGGGASFDFFRGRVMFPVTDRRGRVIAFGARIMGDGQPKYLNSPDTPLFHKGATLYGLAQARDQARDSGQIMAVEGYMDVIALHQAGFCNAVAPLGTAVTEQQIEEMWRLADEPILCLDGDAAGQRAMGRAAERAIPILKPGKSLRFASLPASEDPDSLIQNHGPAAMQAVLAAADPLFEVAWRLTLADRPLDTPERRAAIEHDLKDKAFSIADETVRWQYWNAFREKLRAATRPAWTPSRGAGANGFSGRGAPRPDLIRRRPGDPPLRAVDGRLPGAGRPPPPGSPLARQERLLLSILLVHPSLIESLAERLGECPFTDSGLDKLRQGILKHLDFVRDLDSDGLLAQLRNDGYGKAVDALLDAGARKVARPEAPHEARAIWEHVFALYRHKDLKSDVAHAVEAFAREPSDANFKYLAALISSRDKDWSGDKDLS